MNDRAVMNNAPISPDLEKRIEAISSLPTLPEIYNQLIKELSASEVSMNRIADIVSEDVSISAKLLQVVNSAFFGIQNEIKSVQQAATYLGVDTVKGIVLSAGVYSGGGKSIVPGFSPVDLYKKGVAVGSKARFIAYSFGLVRSMIDDALTAGLLHDVGKLVLIAGFEQELLSSVEYAKKENVPLHVAQEQVLGANDAVIGGFLLNSWGLSNDIVEAVAFHYTPSKSNKFEFDAMAAAHLSFASEYDEEHHIDDPSRSAFDRVYTDTLGVTDQLAQFKGLSAQAVAQQRF